MEREKGKLIIKTTVILKRANVPPGIVPSVLSMVEPNWLTILWIVENTRKTGFLKRILNPGRGIPLSIQKLTASLLRRWKIISRKWGLISKKWKNVSQIKETQCDDSSETSNDSWSVGLGSMGELGHVANVPNKIKKQKIILIPPIRLKLSR